MTGPVLRTLRAADVDAYRALRLDALRQEPAAFGSSHETEAAMTREQWLARVEPDGGTVVGVFVGGQLVSTGAVIPDVLTENGCLMVAMWTDPGHRASGHGGAVVDRVIAEAADRGYSSVSCTVTAGNDRASALYERHGFVFTGRTETRASDGLSVRHMFRPVP